MKGPIAKFLGEDGAERLVKHAGASPGDLVLIVADSAKVTNEVLGKLRADLGAKLKLADENVLAYEWITRFPMYEWDAENERWHATHNPFSGVLPEDEKLLVTADGDPYRPSPRDPAGQARAMQYDIVLNGWELGGGSVRIWKRDLLERSFALQGHKLEDMREKFGAMLEAFDYGAPPHGGIALGIDRWAALFSQPGQHPRGDGLPEDAVGHATSCSRRRRGPSRSSWRSSGCKFVGKRAPEPGAEPGPSAEPGPARTGAEPEPESERLSDAPPAVPAPSGLGILEPIARRPRLAALIGALCIAFSGIFYRYAEVTPATATAFRCLYGLPILALVGLLGAPALRPAAEAAPSGSRSSPACSLRATCCRGTTPSTRSGRVSPPCSAISRCWSSGWSRGSRSARSRRGRCSTRCRWCSSA